MILIGTSEHTVLQTVNEQHSDNFTHFKITSKLFELTHSNSILCAMKCDKSYLGTFVDER